MILQLNPSILVETPMGTGQALFIIDYGMHQNTCWVVVLVKDGVIKHFDCNDVILSTNYTYGLNIMKNKERQDDSVSGKESVNSKDKTGLKNTATRSGSVK